MRHASPFRRDLAYVLPLVQRNQGLIAVPTVIRPRILTESFFQRIVQHISEEPAEFLVVSDNPVIRFVLPHMPSISPQCIDFVGGNTLESFHDSRETVDFAWRQQDMDMVRHDYHRNQSVECLVAQLEVLQRQDLLLDSERTSLCSERDEVCCALDCPMRQMSARGTNEGVEHANQACNQTA